MNIYILYLLTLSIHLTPISAYEPQIHGHELQCLGSDYWFGIRNPTDCSAAIRMIPSGKLHLDIPATVASNGDAKAPLPYVSMEQAGGRRLYLPAAFIAGSCVVLVQATVPPGDTPSGQQPPPRPPPRPPQDAALHMYLRFWPKVKLAAEAILQKCLRPPVQVYKGVVNTSSDLGGWKLLYTVTVEAAMRKGQPKPPYPGYRVYESEKLPWTYGDSVAWVSRIVR